MQEKEADEALLKKVDGLGEDVRKVSAWLKSNLMTVHQQREASRDQLKPVHNLAGVRPSAYKNITYGLGMNSQ